MRPDLQLPEVFLHRQPVDFRKSIDGLSAIVEMDMQQSPFSKATPGIKTAPMPAQLIPKSMATPGLLAYVATSKYVDALPLYRQ